MWNDSKMVNGILQYQQAGCDAAGATGTLSSGYMSPAFTPPTRNLSFQQALACVCDGQRVSRTHMWNEECSMGLNPDTDVLCAHTDGDGYGCPEDLTLDYDDIQARDWYVVEE